jgi:hypothetical protein
VTYLLPRMLFVLYLAVAIQVPAQGQFPGAKGKQIERIGATPAGVEIGAVYVYLPDARPKDGAPRPQRFPSGTARLSLDVGLKSEPPEGVTFDCEVSTSSGKVALADGYMSYMAVPAVHLFSFTYPVQAKSGKFADGAYRLKLLVNGKAVVALNWSIGAQ